LAGFSLHEIFHEKGKKYYIESILNPVSDQGSWGNPLSDGGIDSKKKTVTSDKFKKRPLEFHTVCFTVRYEILNIQDKHNIFQAFI
jgi:hypothetical protein